MEKPKMTKLLESLPESLRKAYSLDIRALAALRIGIAVVLLWDLRVRLGEVVALYSDEGVLPRDIAVNYVLRWAVSFHMMSGLASFEALLMLIAAVCAICLMLGYRTRLFTFLSWILLMSLQNRNTLATFGYDHLMRLTLFWGMFLPWNAAYSVDRVLRTDEVDEPPRQIFSAASVALILQLALVYIFTLLLKTGVEWQNGTAVYYGLNIDYYALPLGRYLLQLHWPQLLSFLTHAALIVEGIIPVLLLFPFRVEVVRMLGILLLFSLHLGIMLIFDVGLWPWVAITTTLVLLPTAFWDWLARKWVSQSPLKIYYDGDCGMCKKLVLLLKTFLILPHTELIPAQSDPEMAARMQMQNSWVIRDEKGDTYTAYDALIFLVETSVFPLRMLAGAMRLVPDSGNALYRWVSTHRKELGERLDFLKFRPLHWESTKTGSAVCIIALCIVLIWNIGTLPNVWDLGSRRPNPNQPVWLVAVAHLTGLRQSWHMFAPSPYPMDGWFVVPGWIANGKPVDAWNESAQAPDWKKPETPAKMHRNYPWKMLLERVLYVPYDFSYMGRYLCYRWNNGKSFHDPERMVRLEIHYIKEATQPDFRPPIVTNQILWQGACL